MFFNAKPLSAFPEEDERLFIGSTKHLTVETLVVIQSAKNYRLSIGAFAKFDQVLNGQEVSGGITEQEMEIIVGALESVKGKGTASKMSKYLDEFAVDNFYLMTLQKTNIILDLNYSIDKLNNQRMKELVVHSVSEYHKVKGPNDTTNVVKAALFPLFPNLSTVTINAINCPFSVSRFLDELSSVDLPGSLSTVIIKDCYSGDSDNWVRKAFGSNLKEKAAAMNMTVDLEEVGEGLIRSDFLTIRSRE